jgi:hypothetical protein
MRRKRHAIDVIRGARSLRCAGHTRCTDVGSMMDSAEDDKVLLDVPESGQPDPFEDDVTEEVVLLDVFKVDPDDVEEVIVLDLRQPDCEDSWLS